TSQEPDENPREPERSRVKGARATERNAESSKPANGSPERSWAGGVTSTPARGLRLVGVKAMSTATKSRQRVKREPAIRLIKPVRDGMGALQITIGGEPHNYLIYTLRSDFGASFRLIKQEFVPQTEGFYELTDTARYNVCLNGQQSTCEC